MRVSQNLQEHSKGCRLGLDFLAKSLTGVSLTTILTNSGTGCPLRFGSLIEGAFHFPSSCNPANPRRLNFKMKDPDTVWTLLFRVLTVFGLLVHGITMKEDN